jgi:hypothetical protein
MNIYEAAEKHKLSLKKLRAMDKDGLLRLDESASASDPIRATLIKGNPLPVSQLVQLIEEPSLLLDLGKYAKDAETQVAALGKPETQVAPKHAAAAVTEAAKNEPEAVALLVDWLRQVIPSRPVGHAYLATRLLLGIPAAIRKYEAPRIGRALLNCRNHPALAGWWKVKPGASQNSTIYQKLALDL